MATILTVRATLIDSAGKEITSKVLDPIGMPAFLNRCDGLTDEGWSVRISSPTRGDRPKRAPAETPAAQPAPTTQAAQANNAARPAQANTAKR